MSLIRNTDTGDKFLEKVKTNADISAYTAIQFYERQLGSQGTSSNTVFSLLTGQYFVGTNTLMVFINGQKAEVSISPSDETQYEETNSTTITFGASLLDTDIVEFIVAGAYKVEDISYLRADNMLIDSQPNNLQANGIKTTLTIQENNIGFGACLSIDSTSGNLIEACADSTSSIVPCKFVALDSGTGDKQVLIKGFIRNDSWSFNPGDTLYLSKSSGLFSNIRVSLTGDIDQILGYALTSNTIYFDPDKTFITLS